MRGEEKNKTRQRKTERKIRVKCKREGWKGGRKERGREERNEGKKERERKRKKKRIKKKIEGDREGRRWADRKRFCFYVSPNAKGSSRLGPVRIFKLCPNGSHTPGQRPSDPEGTLALGGVWCVTSNILASFWAVSQVCLLGLSMSSPHTDLRKCTEDIVLALLTLK